MRIVTVWVLFKKNNDNWLILLLNNPTRLPIFEATSIPINCVVGINLRIVDWTSFIVKLNDFRSNPLFVGNAISNLNEILISYGCILIEDNCIIYFAAHILKSFDEFPIGLDLPSNIQYWWLETNPQNTAEVCFETINWMSVFKFSIDKHFGCHLNCGKLLINTTINIPFGTEEVIHKCIILDHFIKPIKSNGSPIC